MEKQEKISKFMKPLKGGEIFDSSEVEVESVENNLGKSDKKQPLLITFLNKFTQADIEAMEEYVKTHKYQLQLGVKPKITLFEDLYIICEFLKEIVLLRLDKERVKAIDTISDRLQGVIRRSKMTIKERITKKLAHCNVEDVLTAMRNNKDISFNPKADKPKKSYQPQSNSNEEPTTPQPKREQSNDKADLEPIGEPSTAKSVNGNRPYKYGTKENQERIYVYANQSTKQILHFTESKFFEMRAKFAPQLQQIEPIQATIPKKQEVRKENSDGWGFDEEDILINYMRDPQGGRIEMSCLLRYRPVHVVMNKMEKLNLQLTPAVIKQISKLASKPVESPKPVVDELMDLE